MGLIEAYKALKDIKYRISNIDKPIEVVEVKKDSVMICRGDTCFELFEPVKLNNNQYIVPVVKWYGDGRKFKLMEKKYIALGDLNYYMNTSSFVDFADKLKKIKDVETDMIRLLNFFDFLHKKFL
ncbi:MAG: hypothetical protein JHC26_00585 [Thermofilum sp.]|uniref:hypothetical protein n=1 Tax=Thermofilum sp. TaxID=1961369 RepID=UPI002582D3C3|nr:hypothetical protein [Thermofilum sp.]MCI4407562.1 hypothetical protein [Thermofilum sp.]